MADNFHSRTLQSRECFVISETHASDGPDFHITVNPASFKIYPLSKRSELITQITIREGSPALTITFGRDIRPVLTVWTTGAGIM